MISNRMRSAADGDKGTGTQRGGAPLSSVRGIRFVLGVVLAVVTALAQPALGLGGTAFAHAVATQSSIAPGSLQPSLPTRLTLTFGEDIIAGQSDLRVTGPDGASAVTGAPRPEAGSPSLTVQLRSRGGGTYKVFWSSVSAADGQVVSGAFAFAVGYASAPGDLQRDVAALHSTALRALTFFSAIARWLMLVLAIAWAGGALLEVSPGGSSTQAALSGEDAWLLTVAPYAHAARTRLLRLILGLSVLSLVLAACELLAAGRVSPAGSVSGLFSGHMGLARLALLIVPAAALFLQRNASSIRPAATAASAKRSPATVAPRAGRPLPLQDRWVQAAAALLVLFFLATASHAAAVPDLTLSAVVLEWLHSIGAAAWIGGLCYLALAALPALEAGDLDRRAPLLLGLLRRYAVFAGAGIVTLAVTGLFAAQAQLGSRANLRGNSYGDALLIKLFLVVVALLVTAYMLTVQRGYVAQIWASRQRLESLAALDRLGSIIRLGAVIGALVIGATAVLWSDTPPAGGAGALPIAAAPVQPAGSWQSVGLHGRVVHRLLFQPGNRHVLWAATDSGVWQSTDDQRTWHRAGTALQKQVIFDLLSLDQGHDLLAAAGDGKIYRTSDAGKHWERLVRPFGTHPLRVLTQHSTVLVAAGDDGIFRSTDDGRHWHLMLKASGVGIATVYWSPTEQHFLAGVSGGSWRIYNGGADAVTWRAVAGAPAAGGGVMALAMLKGPVTRLIGGAGSGAWVAPRSTGVWQRPAGLAGGAGVGALLPDTRLPGRMYLGTLGAGVYGTVDGGTSWQPLGAHTPSSIYNLVMRPGPAEILYAATSTGAYRLRL